MCVSETNPKALSATCISLPECLLQFSNYVALNVQIVDKITQAIQLEQTDPEQLLMVLNYVRLVTGISEEIDYIKIIADTQIHRYLELVFQKIPAIPN